MGYLIPKQALSKNSSGTIEPQFLMGKSLKVNLIRWLESKVAYYSNLDSGLNSELFFFFLLN